MKVVGCVQGYSRVSIRSNLRKMSSPSPKIDFITIKVWYLSIIGDYIFRTLDRIETNLTYHKTLHTQQITYRKVWVLNISLQLSFLWLDRSHWTLDRFASIYFREHCKFEKSTLFTILFCYFGEHCINMRSCLNLPYNFGKHCIFTISCIYLPFYFGEHCIFTISCLYLPFYFGEHCILLRKINCPWQC